MANNNDTVLESAHFYHGYKDYRCDLNISFQGKRVIITMIANDNSKDTIKIKDYSSSTIAYRKFREVVGTALLAGWKFVERKYGTN